MANVRITSSYGRNMTLEAGGRGSFASISFHDLLSSSQGICLLSSPTHLPCVPGWAPGPGTPRGKDKSIGARGGAAERCGPAGEGAVKVRCRVKWLGAGGQSVGEAAPRARGVSHLFPSLLVTMIM